jgi:hypothetical protein
MDLASQNHATQPAEPIGQKKSTEEKNRQAKNLGRR